MQTYSEIYYETYETDGEKCSVHTFDTCDEAIEHAEKSGIKTVYRIGGDYAEFEKCEFCGEWFDTDQLNKNNYCERCQCAIRDHGFDPEHD